MQVQKIEEKQIPQSLQKLSQTTFVQNLKIGNYSAVRESLPKKIQDVVAQPPICDIEKIVGRGKIVIFIKAELIQLTSRISVSGTITVPQMEFIATQLIEMFPGESLADFKLCFERGAIGQYGEIFRMDGIVLRSWMEKYLDEKYNVVETAKMKEKELIDGKPEVRHGATTEKDWLKIWKDTVLNPPGQIVPGMTQKEVEEQGKEEPPKKKTITDGYKYFNVRGVEILAVTQEHAEEIAEKALKLGMIEEV